MSGGRPIRLSASSGRKKFARNLYAVRTSRHLSEEDVAAGCRFTTSKVRALERATVEPEGADLIKLGSVLGTSVNDLLAGIGPDDFRESERPSARAIGEIEEGCREARLGHLVVITHALRVRATDMLKGMSWESGVLYYEGEPIEEE